MSEKLKAAAREAKIRMMAPQLNSEQQRKLRELGGMSGDEFDRGYSSAQRGARAAAIALFAS